MNYYHQKGLSQQKRGILFLLLALLSFGGVFFLLSVALKVEAASGPPQISHPVEGREDCLKCHGPGLVRPFPENHRAFPQNKEACLQCHQVLPEATAKPAPVPPKVSHVVEGREECLKCHGPGMIEPFPENHRAFPQNKEACLQCHRVLPEATAKPAPAAPEISHPVEGREACLKCHGAGLIRPVPENHLSFPQTKETCLQCHRVASSLSEETCLTCHSQRGLAMPLQSGELLSLTVDPDAFSSSIHGSKLQCTDCHPDISKYPHAQRQVATRRAYSFALYEQCKKCHFANYTKTLDSIHFETLKKGDLTAPLCTDCHGSHDILPPAQPKAKVSRTCSTCHLDVYTDYVGSAHGEALLREDNKDVPVCTDCHGVHDIHDPRTVDFRLKSVALCAGCHDNKELMQKYGISTSVLKTYLEDFHGRTLTLKTKEKVGADFKEPLCIDCHGVHDIMRIDDPQSRVFRANLVSTCRQCHANATENFPAAWLSHYEPSLSQAPLVYSVRWFYRFLIPFIILGLSVHILLDLWRVITGR